MQIGEFSERSGLSTDTLRYYEKIGLMPSPDRDPGGRRTYSSDHLQWVEFLQVLRSTGMGVRDMARYASLREDGLASVADRLDMLEIHREKVAEERRRLAAVEALLTNKIDMFQGVLDGTLKPTDLSCAVGERT